MDIEELNRLIELMNQNDLLEIELVEDARKIRLKKKYDQDPRILATPMAAAIPTAAPVAASAAAAQAPQGGASPVKHAGAIEIKSPMVGTFYRAANPEASPYVEDGDRVEKETAVCIIEAMKVFNEIKAEVEGTIVSILVENGQSVEYGQPLFLVRPD